MPIKIPDTLPARSVLEKEHIFVMTELRALHQDIRPLRIALVNLMPTKITTETQILRCLANTPLQIEVDLVQMSSHQSKNIFTRPSRKSVSASTTAASSRGRRLNSSTMSRSTIGRSCASCSNGRARMSIPRCTSAGARRPAFITTTASPSMCCRRSCSAFSRTPR